MIQITRKYPAPTFLSGTAVQNAKIKIKEIVDGGKYPETKDFKGISHWSDLRVKKELWEMQNYKCCYCERTRDLKYDSDVDHFRPKTKIKDIPKPAYWWLAYEWGNLLFSCKPCNEEYKKTLFPLQDDDNRARDPSNDVKKEVPMIIDPCEEDPEKFIGYIWGDDYGELVTPIGKDPDGRGLKTIEILGLDRIELNEERAGILKTLEGIAEKKIAAKYIPSLEIKNEAEEDIKRETSEGKRYLGFRRAYFRSRGLGDFIS